MNHFLSKRNRILSYQKLREKKSSIHPAGKWLDALLDGPYEETDPDLVTEDPLHFPGYREKLERARMRTMAQDALVCRIGKVAGMEVAAAELCPDFLMGSMGTVVGEKLARLAEEADRRKIPLIVFCASGGARMQEGMHSLMQMAKTAAAVERLKSHGGLYLTVLTNPTTGGVSASFAFLGDVILAESGALIGFAGPRVIEKTIGEKLPKGFQSSEFQLKHGFVDLVVHPEDMKMAVTEILAWHREALRHPACTAERTKTPGGNIPPVQSACGPPGAEKRSSAAGFREKDGTDNPAADISGEEVPPSADPWDRVKEARDTARPKVPDFVDGIFHHFLELHGDRSGGEDRAMLAGLAYLGEQPVVVIGHRKGRNVEENIRFRFGMPEPEGYRKALRLMKLAEKFHVPVITLIDTPGAYPGKEAEEHGQSAAIAENLAAMSRLRVPILSIVTGEGSSGGALGIGVADEIWMCENAVYSVLSPEGFAAILWKDEKRAAEACRLMKMSAADLAEAGIADRILPEPKGGLAEHMEEFCGNLRTALSEELARLSAMPADELVQRRYEKYRNIR